MEWNFIHPRAIYKIHTLSILVVGTGGLPSPKFFKKVCPEKEKLGSVKESKEILPTLVLVTW
jgi:hypothetical protein